MTTVVTAVVDDNDDVGDGHNRTSSSTAVGVEK